MKYSSEIHLSPVRLQLRRRHFWATFGYHKSVTDVSEQSLTR